jgi:hypothetical protein
VFCVAGGRRPIDSWRVSADFPARLERLDAQEVVPRQPAIAASTYAMREDQLMDAARDAVARGEPSQALRVSQQLATYISFLEVAPWHMRCWQLSQLQGQWSVRAPCRPGLLKGAVRLVRLCTDALTAHAFCIMAYSFCSQHFMCLAAKQRRLRSGTGAAAGPPRLPCNNRAAVLAIPRRPGH